PDNKNSDAPFNPELINKMLPVDKYVGGPEHACMHLLYARFITKALRDMGYLTFDEPFKSLTHQGLILGPDGLKMSKSKGNTISPDDYIKEHGSDVFRMYLMFGFAYTEGGAWSDDGVKSVSRFVDRIERALDIVREAKNGETKTTVDKPEKELNFWLHNTIKGMTEDTEIMQFNTAIARMMEFVNALTKYNNEKVKNVEYLTSIAKDFVKILAPFAPHFAEEQWSLFGMEGSIFNTQIPAFDPSALVKDEIEIAIQINGKVKAKINIPSDLNDDGIKEASLNDENVKNAIGDKTVVKVIVIKGRLVNIVIK
ncbi:MAG: class I tRNA ligase family protein, partial [Clostridium sp.]|uniref:class I tRNA ligase family protein n=1 Tax=Clostridium sp. TaxID=1506 RepID=UPI003F2E1946